MRRLLPIALVVLASLAGCGGSEEATPAACLEGARPYLEALEAAPGEARLRGETPISGCLPAGQGGGELAAVGAAMLSAATQLNSAARANPGGGANVRLGYLAGAAARGAAGSGGIHADLVRRLEVAARHSPGRRPLPAAFRRAYARGVEAGLARG